MAEGRVKSTELSAIAAAIRSKNGESTVYKPAEMAQAILEIPSGGSAVIESKSITQNGTYTAPTGVDGYSPVTVAVQPNLQSKTAVENGTVTPDSGYDGLSSVVINVSGGSLFPFVDEGYASESVAVEVGTHSQNLDTLYRTYLYESGGPVIGYRAVLDSSLIGKDLDAFMAAATPSGSDSKEYSGNVSSAMISDCNMELLLDASNNSDSNRQINGNFSDYIAIVLNGVYHTDKTSNYNTTMIYVAPQLNVSYWTGMEDRNTSYDCYVKFTSDTTVNLNGGQKHCVIYGIR